jgi:hypothetical protein
MQEHMAAVIQSTFITLLKPEVHSYYIYSYKAKAKSHN